MCLQDTKIALKQEIRGTSVSVASGATVQLAGQAANRVRIRFAPTTVTGAVGNLNIVIQCLLDSVAIGIGFIGNGVSFVEISLERHSHFVQGPFQAINNSGFTIPIGVAEVLQNSNPADAL